MSISNLAVNNDFKLFCGNCESRIYRNKSNPITYNKILSNKTIINLNTPSIIQPGTNATIYPIVSKPVLLDDTGFFYTIYTTLECNSRTQSGRVFVDLLFKNLTNGKQHKYTQKNSGGNYIRNIDVDNNLTIDIQIFFTDLLVSKWLTSKEGDIIEYSLIIFNETTENLIYNSPLSPAVISLAEVIYSSTPVVINSTSNDPQPPVSN